MTDALLPCLVCGATLQNVLDDDDDFNNQPSEGTEFQTYGHYGSTFWDSFDATQLVINVCDTCLEANKHRLATRKPVRRAVRSVTRMYEKGADVG